MTSGETTPHSDASEPTNLEPDPGSQYEPGDPGDFMTDILDRTQNDPGNVETREGDPGDFSSDRMSTEE